MSNLRLALTTSLNDQLAAPLRRSLDEVQRHFEKLERELKGVTQTADRMGRGLAQMRGPQQAAQEVAKLARETQNAITLTERLQAAWNRTGSMVRGVAAAAAGVTAAGFAAKALLDRPVDYDTRLRGATATAYAGSDKAGLQAGLVKVNELINGTVRSTSGATRDSTLGAYEKLVGSGSFSKEESASLLPTIMKTAVAGRADANDLVQAAEKLKVNQGLGAGEIGVALAKILRGGQEGGFEIKDSAKWIGPLLPYMKGYKGMAGVDHLVTMLQQSRSTAGTNDEAANNLRNFLQKMGADSTAKDFKKQGINLTDEMAKGVLRGETPVQTYMAQIDKVMAMQDPDGKARKAMRAADQLKTPEERASMYQDISRLYQNAGISKIIADLQEFGGYSALAGTKDYGQRVLGAVQNERGGAVNNSYEFMTGGLGAKFTDVGNRKDIAMSDALEGKAGGLNTLLGKAVELADAFPKTTAAATGVTTALALATMAVATFGFAVRANTPGVPLPTGGKVPTTPTTAPKGPFGSLGNGASAVAGGAAMNAGALGLAVAGGLAVTGGAILAAGAGMSAAMNSESGLRARIGNRQDRLGELTEMAQLERAANSGGSSPRVDKLDAEVAAMRAERDALILKLGELVVSQQDAVREMSMMSRRAIELKIDGSTVASAVNERNTWLARRN